MPKSYRGAVLGREQVRDLLFRGVSLRPTSIDGAPRIVCSTAAGELIDLAPPDRDAQRRPAARSGRAPRARKAGGS